MLTFCVIPLRSQISASLYIPNNNTNQSTKTQQTTHNKPSVLVCQHPADVLSSQHCWFACFLVVGVGCDVVVVVVVPVVAVAVAIVLLLQFN
jgi:hypothetical protein